MDPSTPAAIAAAASVAVATIAAAGTVTAAILTRKVEQNTRGVSNGFAGDTTRRLERIEQLIVDHLDDHAQRDLMRRRKN